MRIIIFTNSYELGGAEKHGIKLADYFRNRRNFDAEFWVMEQGTGDQGGLELCREYNIPTRVVGSVDRISHYLYYKQVKHYAPQFRAFRPDAIISFNVIPNLINGLIYKQAGAKTAIWSQQSVNHYQPDSRIERQIIRNMPAFVSNSFHGAEKIKNDFKLPDDKVFVVPNGIAAPTPQYLRSEWLRKLGLNDAVFKAIMVANITGTKDHITLVKAWKTVVKILNLKEIQAVLVLAGRLGNTANEVLKTIHELELIPHVILTGPVTDIDGLNTAMDMGILSSPAEGLPNSIMENMLAGLPVAGTDIAGIREVVGENNYPLLAPVGDPNALAQHILKIANNKELSLTLGAANKKRIEQDFSIAKMTQHTEDVLLRLLHSGR